MRRILILLAIVAVACVIPLAACGGGNATTTQPPSTGTVTTGAATTATTAAATATTVAGAPPAGEPGETGETGETTTRAVGVYFEDQGNHVVKVTDVPFAGVSFPIHTSGPEASTAEAFDASGASLGKLQTDDGLLDYSSMAGKVAKIVVVNPHGTKGEYVVPK